MSSNRQGGGDRGTSNGRGGGRGRYPDNRQLQNQGIGEGAGYGRGDGPNRGGTGQSNRGPGSYRGGQRGGGDGARGTFRGGRGAQQRPSSPVNLDVTKTAKEVDPSTLRQPEGKEYGDEGKEVELVTNHYPVHIEPVPCFQYDIQLKLRRRNGEINDKFKGQFVGNVAIINKMAEEWPQAFQVNGQPSCFFTDGGKYLFSDQELNFEGKQTREVTLTLDGFPEQTFLVTIGFVNQIHFSDIKSFYEGHDVQFNISQVRDVSLQACDILSSYSQKLTHVSLGKALYPIQRQPKDELRSPNENTIIAFGHFQSLVLTEAGLTLNVDRMATAFRTGPEEEPLIEFIKRELSSDRREVRSLDKSLLIGNLEFLSRRLKGLNIFSKHIKKESPDGRMVAEKRNDSIFRLVAASSDQQMIEFSDGKKVSHTQYFADTYKVKLQHSDWPLVELRGHKFQPIELCHVRPNQEMPRSMIDPELQSKLTESTNSMKPLKRFEKIQQARNAIVSEDTQNLMKKFGITIDEDPIRVFGRQLEQPKFQGSRTKLADPFPGGLKRYIVFNLSPKVSRNLGDHYENFFNKVDPNPPKFGQPDDGLIRTATRMGLPIEKDPLNNGDEFSDSDLSSPKRTIDAFKREIEKAKKDYVNLQLIFVVVPKGTTVYEDMKYVAENEYGMVTQGIAEDKFIRPSRGYHNLFTFQVNAKLNGRNILLEPGQFPQFTKEPTMIIGADVCHAGYDSRSNDRVVSSIAAVVGSYDRDFNRYSTTVSAQPPKMEYLTDLNEMVVELLNSFKAKNTIRGKNILPSHIVFFRDGVSEGQLEKVKKEEIPLIEKAFEKVGANFKPKITALVVQKRHHTRFVPTDPGNSKSGNVEKGVYVDHTITSPRDGYDESFLTSHDSPLGTSRPTKYIVLRDDHLMSANEKAKFCYYMCYGYCGCPTPISIPIPVKYADLAAFRTKQHLGRMDTEAMGEKKPRNEDDKDKLDREKRMLAKLNDEIKVHRNLEFRHYYC